MGLVTSRPPSGEGADPPSRRVAVVLASGRFLLLSMLAELAPDNLAEEIERLDLATVLALDPGFGAIREALARVEAGTDADALPSRLDVAIPIVIDRKMNPGPQGVLMPSERICIFRILPYLSRPQRDSFTPT